MRTSTLVLLAAAVTFSFSLESYATGRANRNVSAKASAKKSVRQKPSPIPPKKVMIARGKLPPLQRVALARAPASTGDMKSMGVENGRAMEVRGQSRTLSMMLVLKNGKETFNFIKVRKDFNPEILATQF